MQVPEFFFEILVFATKHGPVGKRSPAARPKACAVGPPWEPDLDGARPRVHAGSPRRCVRQFPGVRDRVRSWSRPGCVGSGGISGHGCSNAHDEEKANRRI